MTPLSPNHHHHLMYCRIQRLRWQERVMGMLLEPGKAVHRLIAHYLWLALPQYYFHCWFSCFWSIPTKIWCFKPIFPPQKTFPVKIIFMLSWVSVSEDKNLPKADNSHHRHHRRRCTFFQASAVFCTEIAKFWSTRPFYMLFWFCIPTLLQLS